MPDVRPTWIPRLPEPTRFRTARVYETLRTAHLERARALPPATILYRARRYDFDAAQASSLDVHRLTRITMVGKLARSRLSTLEVNEPLMREGVITAALAVATVRAVNAVRGGSTSVVTYAIANHAYVLHQDRTETYRAARQRFDVWLARFVASQVDRVVFGTGDSRAHYEAELGRPLARAATKLVPCLPCPCPCRDDHQREANQVLYLGALHPRKGVRELLRAWPRVTEREPSARLTIIGKGPLEAEVRGFAAEHEGVRVVVDPPRHEIHRQLRGSSVLVLLSQPTSSWREQVGLPIVEGLAHGCTTVTTTETGLSSWLVAHGHCVLPPDAASAAVADGIVRTLHLRRPASAVLADLPSADGRLAADAWLFRS